MLILYLEYGIIYSGRYGLVARDRLQAGLARATVVVQTGVKGGTMHAVNAPLCPVVSHPMASPEIMLKPLLANSKAKNSPALIPLGVGSRVPITAIPGVSNTLISPR